MIPRRRCFCRTTRLTFARSKASPKRQQIGRAAGCSSDVHHLRDQAVTDRPKPVRDDSPPTLLLQNYQTYLRKEQGLTEETADNYLRFVSPLVRTCLLGSATGTVSSDIGVQQVRDYLLKSTRTLRPTTAQLVATALRSFLRFLFLRGEIAVDLTAAVPSVRRWRKATVHPYLRPEEVEQLLGACDRTTANGRRDHAVLLLIPRLHNPP